MKKIFTTPFLWYLRTLAKIQLKKINPLIIGVGGASGKSSVSQLTCLVLGGKFKVKQGRGKNSETGIPLNILDIELSDYSLFSWFKVVFFAPLKILTNWEKYDIYVVEMGIDSPFPPKNMGYLLEFIKPKIGVLTNINLEHSVYFDKLVKTDDTLQRKEEILEKIAKEEELLLKSIDESGRSIVNLDNLYIKKILPLKSKTVTVSAIDKNADFYISKILIEENSFVVNFTFLKEVYEIKIANALPKYYAYSFIFTIAIAFSCEINIKDGINLLENKFSLPPGRFGVFKGIKNSTIFDSSYNSSLEAATGAMQVIKEVGKTRRKVGILGDMRELGSLSQIQHELLAKEILKNLDLTILIGPLMNQFVAPVLEKENFEFKSFNTFKEAKDSLIDLIKKDDIILVKGSQNNLFLERAVELLLEDKADRDKLCRRGSYWVKIRQKTP